MEKKKIELNASDGVQYELSFIRHQLTAVMNHFRIEGCKCSTCVEVRKSGAPEHEGFPPILTPNLPNDFAQQQTASLDLIQMATLPLQVVQRTHHDFPFPVPSEPQNLNFGERYLDEETVAKIRASEKLEEEKRLKEWKNCEFPSGFFERLNGPSIPSTSSAFVSTRSSSFSPTVSANTYYPEPSPFSVTTTSPAPQLVTQAMTDMLNFNFQQHNAGPSAVSPAPFRGIGTHSSTEHDRRTSRLLIGCELDAALVDHMVQLKQLRPPGFRFTPLEATATARRFILNQDPSILKENGGPVQLDKAWATRLASRVEKRYQTNHERGLQPGTLNNVHINSMNLFPPSGNSMSDITAQNYIQQQLLHSIMGGIPPTLDVPKI